MKNKAAKLKRPRVASKELSALADKLQLNRRSHFLKEWRDNFEHPVPFQVRKNDRDFRVGDTLVLCSFEPRRRRYCGHIRIETVTRIQAKAPWLKAGYVGMLTRQTQNGTFTRWVTGLAGAPESTRIVMNGGEIRVIDKRGKVLK